MALTDAYRDWVRLMVAEALWHAMDTAVPATARDDDHECGTTTVSASRATVGLPNRVFPAFARADKPFDFAQDIGHPWHTETAHGAESVGWARGPAPRRAVGPARHRR